jgi:D-alanyl-lipoteichoic acid acyltransferase DltB (MBOAT superfamily)
MNVASTPFLDYGLAVCIVYNLNRRLSWRQAVLLIANIGFLTTFSNSPLSWVPFAAFIVLGYLSYLILHHRKRGAAIPLILAVIFAFFWLKKYTFLPSSLFLGFPYVTIGLSYVLFRLLHLLIDTEQGVITEKISPLSFTNYLLNFTAIVSGPIQMFPAYAQSQLRADHREPLNLIVVAEAAQRIIWGYFKIAITGAIFSQVQTHYLETLGEAASQSFGNRSLSAAIITAAYPLYLYCNFSGYTDIVIGVAKGCRLTLPENFDRPFSSTNFLEFWSRWHISLSTWLKTYVYSPLLKTLMMRFPDKNTAAYLGVFSYFTTFFLIGVWHGRTSEFVVFGILQGGGVSVNKLYQLRMTKLLGKKGYRELSEVVWYQALSRGLTFAFFGFSLVWFWSTWSQMSSVLDALGGPAIVAGLAGILAVAAVVLTAWEALRSFALTIRWRQAPLLTSRYLATVVDTAMVVVMAATLTLLSMPAPEVVYKTF